MPMKRIFATLIFALPLLFCGCSEEEDILPEQRQKIVSYLERTHSPALIPESQVETGSQQRFYTMSGSTVYRYIDNFYRDGRSELPEVTAAAKATITFRAYVFAFSNITDSTFPFYSNDPALQQAYEDMGLTPGAWSFEPLTLDMRGGHTKRAAACVTWLSRRRHRRSLHDLQYGLRGQICEHDSERKPRRLVFHGRKRGVRQIDRTPNL